MKATHPPVPAKHHNRDRPHHIDSRPPVVLFPADRFQRLQQADERDGKLL